MVSRLTIKRGECLLYIWMAKQPSFIKYNSQIQKATVTKGLHAHERPVQRGRLMLYVLRTVSLHWPHGMLKTMHDVVAIFMTFEFACPSDHWWFTLLHLSRALPTSMELQVCKNSAFARCPWHPWNAQPVGNETALHKLWSRLECSRYEHGTTKKHSDTYASVSEIRKQPARNHKSSLKIHACGIKRFKFCNIRVQAYEFEIWNPSRQHARTH